jgi:propanol-preferring alcohol dehydrogenase
MDQRKEIHMRAVRLSSPGLIENNPLQATEVIVPKVDEHQLLIQIQACGICHTDLHTIEGEIIPPRYPIIPGHQAVGRVVAMGESVQGWSIGDRVGIPWLYAACGTCSFCKRGQENLCPEAVFTGFHHDGGYAEFMAADARYALHIPEGISDVLAAPLLCAGIIGYRSLRVAQVEPGERLGLFGFGASAHLAIQVAIHWDCEVYVFTRSEGHRKLASELGASWVGGAEERAPITLDRAILFAPVGTLVPLILEKLRPGGTLAINAIHLSPIPELAYHLIYGERTLRSVANATYRDGVEFLELAARIPVSATTHTYPLESANKALLDLKESRIDGAGVLIP